MEIGPGKDARKKFQGAGVSSNGSVSMKRKANDDPRKEPEINDVEDIHNVCIGPVCKFPNRGNCKDPSHGKRVKVGQVAFKSSFGTPGFKNLHSATLNKPDTTVKSLHVDTQQRFVIQQRLSKVVSNRDVTVTYVIKSEKTGDCRTLCLKNMWTQNDWLVPGTVVNIVDVVPDDVGRYTVDRCSGYLIVNPDKLVSVTSVIGQLYCERKAALARCSVGSDSMVTFRGVVAHELICEAMVHKIKTDAELLETVKEICRRPEMLERAYGIGMSDAELAKIQTDCAQWVGVFMRQRFTGRAKKDMKYQNFEFIDVLGIEDNIWNPSYGLKGKIDATMLVERNTKRMVVPLEFKTGSTKSAKRQATKADHVGQVTLYTLMMAMKFGNIEEALLYYISDDSLSSHTPRSLELQQLIIFRNSFIKNSVLSDGQLVNLPKPENIDYDFKCKNCEVRNICTLEIANKNMPTQSMSTTEKALMSVWPYTDVEQNFFENWMFVINSETEEVEKKFSDKGIWRKTPEEREDNGTCVANLKLKSKTCTPMRDSNLKLLFLVTFAKPRSDTKYNFCITTEDFVALSSNVEVNINYAIVKAIRNDMITLAFDQPLHYEYFQSDFIYAIDKINTSSPIASQYGYLAKLMELDTPASRLRDYIIHKKNPKYEDMPIPPSSTQEIVKHLNAEQKRVIFKSLSTDSFLFVQGSPGSGKTATIVCLLRTLVEWGKTVLVVTYTGTALENILVRYAEHRQDFIRISSSKTHPKLHKFTTKVLSTEAKTIQEMREAYNKPVVATTLLSLKHSIFQNRRFDYCIVDEASQALPTAVFGALLLCDKYIVFGDPKQLPPVMTSSALKDRGLSDNFFSLMANPNSTVKMNLQYRMNRCINQLANGLMYENQMVCANTQLERAYIPLPEEKIREFLSTQVRVPSARRVFCHIISKKREKAVVFLDTSNIPAFETYMDATICNESERNLVMSCSRIMIECGISAEQIGVIAPYRGQVKLLKTALGNMSDTRFHDVEVNTVDQYQGREMEVIICSFTKSMSKDMNAKAALKQQNKSDQSHPSEKESILEDIRRLNVAITRARVKLVLIGNRDTLIRFAPFKKLFNLLTAEQIHLLDEPEYNGVVYSYLSQLQENDENMPKKRDPLALSPPHD